MSWDIVAAYLALCMTVATVILHVVFFPALDTAIVLEIDNEFTRHPNLASCTQFVLNTLIAPVLIIVAIMPGMWAAYVAGTEQVILAPREIQT